MKERLDPIKNLNPIYQGELWRRDLRGAFKKPKVDDPAPPVSATADPSVLSTQRDQMRRELSRKGLRSTILAGAYRPGTQMQPTIGRRSLLGQVAS